MVRYRRFGFINRVRKPCYQYNFYRTDFAENVCVSLVRSPAKAKIGTRRFNATHFKHGQTLLTTDQGMKRLKFYLWIEYELRNRITQFVRRCKCSFQGISYLQSSRPKPSFNSYLQLQYQIVQNDLRAKNYEPNWKDKCSCMSCVCWTNSLFRDEFFELWPIPTLAGVGVVVLILSCVIRYSFKEK